MEVRPAGIDVAEAVARLAATVFHSAREEGDTDAVRASLEDATRVGAYDDGELVGFAASRPLRLTIPGRELPCAGVTLVGVLPSHRRQGLLRRLLTALLEPARQPVAALWASEPAIYGRFGFGAAARGVDLHVDVTRGLPLRIEPAAGRLRLRTPEEALPELVPFHAELRGRRAGRIVRDETWWRAHLFAPSWQDPGDPAPRTGKYAVLLGEPGRLEGYAIYRVALRPTDVVAPRVSVELRELEARTPAAEAALWRFLADLDLTDELVAAGRPVDDPVLLLADRHQVTVTAEKETLWLALLDVPAALEARSWAADCELRVAVGGAGAVALRIAGGAATCAPLPDAGPVDLTLDRRELASAFLGGTRLASMLDAGLLTEHTPGAVAALDAALLTPRAPHTPDMF